MRKELHKRFRFVNVLPLFCLVATDDHFDGTRDDEVSGGDLGLGWRRLSEEAVAGLVG